MIFTFFTQTNKKVKCSSPIQLDLPLDQFSQLVAMSVYMYVPSIRDWNRKSWRLLVKEHSANIAWLKTSFGRFLQLFSFKGNMWQKTDMINVKWHMFFVFFLYFFCISLWYYCYRPEPIIEWTWADKIDRWVIWRSCFIKLEVFYTYLSKRIF